MDYTVTLEEDFDQALARWAKESNATPEALIDSVVRGSLQSRVEERKAAVRESLLSVIEQLPDHATKAEILAAAESAQAKKDGSTDAAVSADVQDVKGKG